MGKIKVKSLVTKKDNGFIFLPATSADKLVLEQFLSKSDNKYVSITLNNSRGNKTYDQVKTIWALISVIYEAAYRCKPTTEQANSLYNELVFKFAPKEESVLKEEELVPVSLSSMSVFQAASFIQCIINYIAESFSLSDDLQCDMKDIFETFQSFMGTLWTAPIDTDDKGEYLKTEEWVQKNPVSHASGLKENLEIAHIVSKGTAPQYRDCCWNFLRLTHEEHIEIQHKKGWETFLEIYPHLIGRVKKARELAHKIDTLTNLQPDIF